MKEQIKIQLNGREKLLAPQSLHDLLRSLNLSSLEFGVAVCVNDQIIDKSGWSRTLANNDKVEVIRAFQGG